MLVEKINMKKLNYTEDLLKKQFNIDVACVYSDANYHVLVAYDKNGIVKETTVITPRKLTEFIGNKYLYDRYYEPCTGRRASL